MVGRGGGWVASISSSRSGGSGSGSGNGRSSSSSSMMAMVTVLSLVGIYAPSTLGPELPRP